MGRALILAALLAVAACDRPAQPAADAPTPAAADPAPAPVAAAIIVPDGKFDAISNTAMSVTGDLTAQNGAFTFAQGQTYRLEGAALAVGADAYATTKASLASLINVADTAELKVLRVTSEDPGKARNGGFCGKDKTTFLVTHDGVDGSGGPAFFIMAFKGAAAPSETSPETDLCGTFMYAPHDG